jgi:hypothetical protein
MSLGLDSGVLFTVFVANVGFEGLPLKAAAIIFVRAVDYCDFRQSRAI